MFIFAHLLLFSIVVLWGATAFTDNTFFCSESWDKSPLMLKDILGTGIADCSCGDNALRSISLSFAVGEWFSGDAARKASAINKHGDISEWDVSQVRSMKSLFATGQNGDYNSQPFSTQEFNSDLSKWVTSKVTNMAHMFDMSYGVTYTDEGEEVPPLTLFNSKLTNFDTSNVVDMSYMFSNAIKFNQDLLNFDTRKVTYFECMFQGAYHFNGDVSSFETAQAVDPVYPENTRVGGFLGGSSFNRTVCGGTWVDNNNQLLDVREGVAGRLGCCPAGSFMSNPFSNPFNPVDSCDVCPPGRFTSFETDDTSCRGKCPAGKSNGPNSTSISSCEDCPTAKTSSVGAGCICKCGDPKSESCSACAPLPDGMYAKGTALYSEIAEQGKWYDGSEYSDRRIGSFNGVIDDITGSDPIKKANAILKYGAISNWDVSQISDMSGAFYGKDRKSVV